VMRSRLEQAIEMSLHRDYIGSDEARILRKELCSHG